MTERTDAPPNERIAQLVNQIRMNNGVHAEDAISFIAKLEALVLVSRSLAERTEAMFRSVDPTGSIANEWASALKSAAPQEPAQIASGVPVSGPAAAAPVATTPNTDAKLRVVAWLHRRHSTAYVITDSVKHLWLKARPDVVENYTVPLYFGDTLGDEK